MPNLFLTKVSPRFKRRSQRQCKKAAAVAADSPPPAPPSPVASPKLLSPVAANSPAAAVGGLFAQDPSPDAQLFGNHGLIGGHTSPPFRFGPTSPPSLLAPAIERLAIEDANEANRPLLQGAPFNLAPEIERLAIEDANEANRPRPLLQDAPFRNLPAIGKRLPPPKNPKFIVPLGELPIFDTERVIHDEDVGIAPEERSRLGDGTLKIIYDLRKSNNDPSVSKTWVCFESNEGIVKLQFQTPSEEYASRHFTSNCGEQNYILADVFDQSLHAERELAAPSRAFQGLRSSFIRKKTSTWL